MDIPSIPHYFPPPHHPPSHNHPPLPPIHLSPPRPRSRPLPPRPRPRIPNINNPQTIGGTFYPTTPPQPQHLPRNSTIVLHFHSGSFLFGSGRTSQCAFAASLLTSHIATFAFFPQYRLARKESGYFPAALQDAVASYVWLVDVMGFEARKIIISGDGAGGALALGLVRWLGQQRVGLQSPLRCLLWSPQLDLAGQMGEIGNVRIQSKTDYLEVRMLKWASELYLGPRSQQSGRDLGRDQLAKSPYVSPSRHPFATSIAIWIMVGKAETLRNTIVGFAEIMSSVTGNTVGWFEIDAAPHNIFMMGERLGWKKQAEDTAREAGMWLRKKGWTGAGRWTITVSGRTREGKESERSGDVLFE